MDFKGGASGTSRREWHGKGDPGKCMKEQPKVYCNKRDGLAPDRPDVKINKKATLS